MLPPPQLQKLKQRQRQKQPLQLLWAALARPLLLHPPLPLRAPLAPLQQALPLLLLLTLAQGGGEGPQGVAGQAPQAQLLRPCLAVGDPLRACSWGPQAAGGQLQEWGPQVVGAH